MKKVIAASLLIIILLLISCRIWDEDSTVGSETCDRYDNAITVVFATESELDSVQFFMNGIQVCIPYDNDLFQRNRGEQNFQGSLYYTSNTKCNYICRNESDYVILKTFVCRVGAVCDKMKGELTSFFIKTYSFDKVDSILLTKDGFVPIAYNNAYKILPKSDSSWLYYLKEENFIPTGCQGDFCFAEYSSDSLLCIDAHSDTPKTKFENVCTDGTGFNY